jgi:xylulose-5-phosphate/fructose-6-phosphate phosphoketolase
VVAGKQPQLHTWTMDEAIAHCTAASGIWEWASMTTVELPDVVLACAGDVPTLESVAAVEPAPPAPAGAEVRLVNVVDLMRLQDERELPARVRRPRVRRAVHHRTGRSSSPTTATRG